MSCEVKERRGNISQFPNKIEYQTLLKKGEEKMKKVFLIALVLGFAIAITNPGWCDCNTIQSGLIKASTGVLTTGYDDFGYNYEAHIFNGRYCDYTRVIGGDLCDVDLVMKWNDAWLSNKDCDGDHLLDRHFGYVSYKGSGAWVTNHQSGKVDVNGKLRTWTYFLKIVAVPEDGVQNGYNWYTADGILIGEAIWGPFAIIEEVSNDPSAGQHGRLFKSPAGPGFGIYGHEGE